MNLPAIAIDYELEVERSLLEAAVAEARTDSRPSVSHNQVRSEMLRKIVLLRSNHVA